MPSSVSRDDNAVPGCLRRRVASRRGAVRSGGEGRKFSVLSFTPQSIAHPPAAVAPHPLSFIPDAFEFTSAVLPPPEGSLALLVSRRVLMYRRARIRIIPRNCVDQCFATDSEERGRALVKSIVPTRIGFRLGLLIVAIVLRFLDESYPYSISPNSAENI